MRRAMTAPALVVVLLLVAACGAESADVEGSETTIEIEARDNEFVPDTLSVPAGARATVVVNNTGENDHTFTIGELDVDLFVGAGDSESVTFEAPEDTVRFVCTLHEALGMVGDVVPAG